MSLITDVLLNWKISIIAVGFLASIVLLNNIICLLPVSGFTFLTISALVWFISLCLTFFYLHKLMQRNEPLQFDQIKYTSIKQTKGEVKPNREKLKVLIEDLDKNFISKWYQYISTNDEFTQESKFFLEEVIRRLIEIQSVVNNKVLVHGILNIFLRHLKEYRRDLKRREKYDGNVEDLYRYSHIVSTNPKIKDYFIQQLTTNVMRHFINSELWNSLPCHLLVSIIARKLILFLLHLISNPETINYNIFNILASKVVKEKYNLDNYGKIHIIQYYDTNDSKKQVVDKKNDLSVDDKPTHIVSATVQFKDSVPKTDDKHEYTPVDVRKRKNGVISQQKPKINPETQKIVDAAEEVKEEQNRSKKTVSSVPVKIHEPKLTRNTKTYADTKDLAFGISLGQDPLDALPLTMENMKSKIEHVEDSANLLLNEVKQTTQSTMEGLKSSIKPISDATVHTLHNIKDLQESTMNNALHKIGDFQDEAAGVVEGILDFGRAGFRKGLRLTGLQDNIEQAKSSLNIAPSSKQVPKKKMPKLLRSDSIEKMSTTEESVWINPLQMESPNFDGQILLEKSTENIDTYRSDLDIPSISMEEASSGGNSPDPEYEDAADLASSIAKLRCLLQQRSSESSMSTPALSPMLLQARYYGLRYWVNDRLQYFQARPTDDLGQKPLEVENTLDSDEVDGMIPSFYKFCAKTATGVLDKTILSIKTALPGHVPGVEHSDNAWIFLQTDQNEDDIILRMKKLLSERKEYCTLDTEIDSAYEAIDSLDTFQQSLFSKNMEFEDELDEFEAKLPIAKALIDIVCELLIDTDSPLVREPLVKAALLILGNTIEKYVIERVDFFMENLCMNFMTFPEATNTNVLQMELEKFVELICASLPDVTKMIFGENALQKAIYLLVSSLQTQKINEDVLLQIFELISLKLIEESSRPTPPTSA